MAYRLTWSPEAVEDVESIAVYIARDSSFYAQSVVNKILEVSRNIQEYPFMGRVVPEFNSVAIRERLVYSYRLVYQITGQKILVVAVIHGKRLLQNVEERFEE
ncbi:MAG: type II toxin-antitoxin system RelE/ParE family toxin [Candidatus Hydrogenedentes bacterium]|nr:type II toxin-antitoxin system RelE/ParE family toxin [Candidatus Hydrogenedentota bacterium]